MCVGANERFVGRARRVGRELVKTMGKEIHDARVNLGLSQQAVAGRAGLSRAKVGRIERGECVRVPMVELVLVAAVVGLELSVRAFPAGPGLRDHVHAALLERFRKFLHAALKWATEVPLPNPRDQRAWDAMVSGARFRIGIEAETRVRDGQALERRIRAKQRDGGVNAVILILSDTRANRAFVRERSASFADLFPVPAAEAIEAVRAGRTPRGNTLILM